MNEIVDAVISIKSTVPTSAYCMSIDRRGQLLDRLGIELNLRTEEGLARISTPNCKGNTAVIYFFRATRTVNPAWHLGVRCRNVRIQRTLNTARIRIASSG